MKIFFITPKLNFFTAGGSTDEYDFICRKLQSLGNDVTVITTFPEANNIPTHPPYKVVGEKIFSKRLLGIQYGVYKILKKYSKEADIFHLDGQVYLYGAGFYRRFGGKVPVAVYFNRELIAWSSNISSFFKTAKKDKVLTYLKKTLRFYIERHLLIPFANAIDLFAFTNPHLEKKYNDFGLATKDKNIYIGDPIDYKNLMESNDVAEDFYIKRNKVNGILSIFYSSRMAPGKGFDLLLTAFSKLKNKERFRLILGGSGPEEELIHKMTKNLGLDPYVEFPGWMSKEELFNNFKSADIFIQPSWRKELTSMSLMTAMIFGLPIIIPNGGGLEWMADDGALYFKAGDSDDLAVKIEQLGNNHNLRAELSTQTYKRLSSDGLNPDKRVNAWYKRMRDVVESERIKKS